MKLIIDINKEDYEYIRENKGMHYTMTTGICEAIFDGTPLPEGHGDLIDRNECLKLKMTDLHDKDGVTMYAVPTGNILRMKPVIEADKGEQE